MDFSIKLEELHRMEMLFRKSASNIGNNKNSFSGSSNSVDSNIKNRRDINYKLHTLYKDLDDIELQLYRIGDFLADTRKSYLGAEERIQMYKNSAEINRHKKVQQPDKKEENFFTRIGNSFSSGIEHIKNFFSNSSDEKNNDSVLDYLERSAKQVIMGNYTDEVTVWGTGMQLCLGLTGADIVMDIRDIVYDFHKWEWSFEHVGQTGFDVLSVAPLIGALKYGDEVVDLVKGVNKTSDVVKNVDRTTDVIKGASETVDLMKSSPIEIPFSAKITEQMKTGYDQIKYKWSQDGLKFEARWHTRTPGAPIDQGNTWVITRTTPGTATGQRKMKEILIGENKWVTMNEWQKAITARKNGVATAVQDAMLEAGHWPAP